MDRIFKSEIFETRGFHVCNNVHCIVANFLDDPTKLAYLIFNGVFLKNVKFKKDQKEFYRNDPVMLSPIVRAIIPNNTVYKSHMYMYIIVSEILSKITNKTDIMLGGSWCLKLFEIQCGIYRHWTPNNINFYSSYATYRKNRNNLLCMSFADKMKSIMSGDIKDEYVHNKNINSMHNFTLYDKYFHINIELTTFNKNVFVEENIILSTDINLTSCCFDGVLFYAAVDYKHDVKYGYLKYTIFNDLFLSDENIYSDEEIHNDEEIKLSNTHQNHIIDRIQKYNRYYLKSLKHISDKNIILDANSKITQYIKFCKL